MKSNSLVERIRLTLGDAREDLGLSKRTLAELAGVSASTIARAENGGSVSPRALVQISLTLTALELHRPPPPALDDELAAFLGLAT